MRVGAEGWYVRIKREEIARIYVLIRELLARNGLMPVKKTIE